MIKLHCDLCGDSKSRIAFNMVITNLDCRYETNTTVVLKEKNILLCPACYQKLQLPNIYKEEKMK